MSNTGLELTRTHPNHLPSAVVAPTHTTKSEATGGESFGTLIARSLTEVSTLDQQHANLTLASIIDPQSVDTHDISISATKAQISLALARNVIDRVINAYREMTSLR